MSRRYFLHWQKKKKKELHIYIDPTSLHVGLDSSCRIKAKVNASLEWCVESHRYVFYSKCLCLIDWLVSGHNPPTLPMKHFIIQLSWDTISPTQLESRVQTCWHWTRCGCCHHSADHLGGVWTSPPTLHTHSTQARWIDPWLLTLVEYHWANSGTGILHNHLTGCIAGISTVNTTSCMGKWQRYLNGYCLLVTNTG